MRENTIFRDKIQDFVGRLRWLRIVKESKEGRGGPNHLSHAVNKTVISQKFQFIIFHDILLCNSYGKLRIIVHSFVRSLVGFLVEITDKRYYSKQITFHEEENSRHFTFHAKKCAQSRFARIPYITLYCRVY